MTSVIGIVAYIVGMIIVILCSAFVGAMIERRRIASALRKLPIYQEEFQYYLDRLDLNDNPFDYRYSGEE